MAILSDVFVRPTGAFERLNAKPSFWTPLFIVIGAMLAGALAYFSQVDMAWFNDQLLQREPELQKLARTGSASAITREALLATSIASILFLTPLGRLLEAGFYSLAGGAINADKSFRHWLALACWSSMPMLVIPVVSLAILIFDGNGQVMQEQLNPLSLNELIFKLPPSAKGFTLANTLTLMHPWAWMLAAVGIRQFTGKSWALSLSLAIAPWLLLFGGWFGYIVS